MLTIITRELESIFLVSQVLLQTDRMMCHLAAGLRKARNVKARHETAVDAE